MSEQGQFGEEEWGLIARMSEAPLSAQPGELNRAWDAFAAGQTPPGLRGTVLASWQRSRRLGINPEAFRYTFIAPEQLRAVLESNAGLITIAQEVMRNLLAYNPDGHINLTDAHGVTIAFCGQDLTPIGSILLESVQGTNCSGRCLSENRLVWLLSEENYMRALRERGKHCAAAPVRDELGNLLGVLTLTASQHAFHYHTLGTVQAAAEAISQQLKLRQLLNEQASIVESLHEGVIVTGPQGTIRLLNPYARQVLALSDEVRYQDIDAVLKPEGVSLKALPACRDRNLTVCPDGRTRVSCLISVVITPEGGRVISLREHRRIREITRRVLGSSASYSFEMICGQSAALRSVLNMARAAARSDSTVLLSGESGTGKELFAQSIHNASARQSGPFLALNCGALPRDLVQSELFGYEDGAFTGSRKGGAAGKFELADGGTLFLDEIGDMPLEAQTSLLRVLQEGEVTRIGGKRPLAVDVRIIAATHRDLLKAVENGSFRRDLWFRLNVIGLAVPPLRERREDIADLTALFCDKVSRALQRPLPAFSDEALRVLSGYAWPGNVRELENVVERTLNICEGATIAADNLPDELRLSAGPLRGSATSSASGSLKAVEKAQIEACLRELQGNLRQVALTLNLSRGALYNKIRRHGIDVAAFRPSAP
ncbi:AAA domain-containing protein [Erwinia sp. E602]|uniref:sigma-54-dependent Fis family transcriptional regulator n=1 Tax=unclassified Erwinia TaxID=2622719 RepID=UPI0006FF9860|nr:AAA family ATPase [Erwinia sp. Leaf53]QUG73921.1 AAA domain-containing protein [Erwinia sp. E602]